MSRYDGSVIEHLLIKSHPPETARQIFKDKIEHGRPILRNRTSPPPLPNPIARAARRAAREKERARSKQKPKPLSARERRRRGLYSIPRSGKKYSVFEPLHALWLGYIRGILGQDIHVGSPATAATLSSADFHGAKVVVSRSGCVSRVGLAGIVIKDSKFAFEVITKDNKVKLVPKEGTTFRVEIPLPDPEAKCATPFVFEILGDQFLTRSADRAKKKFKQHFLKTL
jgi:ribonuclease P protein subunit POP4